MSKPTPANGRKKITDATAAISRATIADVAAAARVDPSTVSRVLSSDPAQRVREDTKRRILNAAQELNYQPNVIARSLRSAKTYSLGIAVPQLDNPVFAMAIQGAERAARERGYSLLISHIEPGAPDSAVYQRMSELNRVDGLLVATLETDRELVGALKRTGVPFVLLNRRIASVANCIVLDSRAAAHQAVDHLVSLGHRRIAHLAGHLDGFNGAERFAGYKEALTRHKIAFDPTLVVAAGYSASGGAEAMRTLLSREGPRPTAIFAATVVSAAGALSVLHAADIEVPRDVSVIALHDSIIAEMLFPPLTTVRLPVEEMGYRGAIGLIDLLEGRREDVGCTLPPERLIVRASTAKPRI